MDGFELQRLKSRHGAEIEREERMNLENCGRCGLEPETVPNGNDPEDRWGLCPVGHSGKHAMSPQDWNAAQFAHKTERINAAAVAICAGQHPNDTFEGDVLDAEELIGMEDARARVRWAEMQKGE